MCVSVCLYVCALTLLTPRCCKARSTLFSLSDCLVLSLVYQAADVVATTTKPPHDDHLILSNTTTSVCVCVVCLSLFLPFPSHATTASTSLPSSSWSTKKNLYRKILCRKGFFPVGFSGDFFVWFFRTF